MKFWEVFRFEVYYQLRRPSTWIYFVAVVGLIFLVLDELVEYSAHTGGEMLINSPIAVAEITGYANKFGLLLIAALVGDGAMRDLQARIAPLLYTSPLSKISYLGGRFLGTFSIAGVLMLLAVPTSMAIAHYTMDAALFGQFQPFAYFNSSLFLTLPNVFIATAIVYCMVLFNRRAMAAYAGGLLIFVLSTFSLIISAGNWTLGSLIDPFGITVISALHRSLTPIQLNTELIVLEGTLLTNRILWLGISLLAGTLAYFRFQLSFEAQRMVRKNAISTNTTIPLKEQAIQPKCLKTSRQFDSKTRIYQSTTLALRYFREVVLSPTGWAIPAIALYAFILIPNMIQGPLSVPSLPTTARIITIMNNAALEIIVVMFITLVAGQVIWGERDARLHEISDAVPVPSRVMIISKFIGIALALFTLQAALMASGIAIQLMEGVYQFDIGHYLQVLFGFQLIDYLLLTAMAVAIHVVVNQKYVGHMLVLLFYVYTLLPARLGIEHKLLVFGSDTGLAASPFYGQEPFILSWLLFKGYWIGWAFIMLIIARQLWVRGRETSFSLRLQEAFNGIKRSPLLFATFILVLLLGGLIFYNTNVLNEYTTTEESIQQQADYERLYGQYRGISQPQLTGTRLLVEFYPEERMAVVQGTYQLKNSSESRIDSIHLALAREVETSGIRFNRKAKAVLTDNRLRHRIYALEKPLQPGDSLELSYEVRFIPEGFPNRGIITSVINNGTYFRNTDWLPVVGYQAGRELSSDKERKERGLPKRLEPPSPYDTAALLTTLRQERIRFEVTVGTSADQIAVAPGRLIRNWREGERQYFHYVADKHIRNMYHIYSADYAVRKAQWKEVDLRIFHHPQNTLNLDRMERAMKASLEYYSKNLSPYQHRQLKLVEYPDPGTSGISFPGTIGYSTNFGLLNPDGDSRELDLPFAAVAHEVAHQWWAHQLIPARVEGAALLSESLAWYSALGVVEQEYGTVHLRKLVDAMRRDYLNPRSRAAVPLLRANDYALGYRKGPLVMYALREYVGEGQVNLALRNLLDKFKAGEPPFATSLDFYAEVQAVTHDSLNYLLHDLFATNTFWDLETRAATMQPAADGGWLLTMEIAAQKVRVDQDGIETVVPMDEYIELGVFGKGKGNINRTLYSKKHRIQSGLNQITIQLNQKAETAGIDPHHLLIDTEISDNIKPVKVLD